MHASGNLSGEKNVIGINCFLRAFFSVRKQRSVREQYGERVADHPGEGQVAMLFCRCESTVERSHEVRGRYTS
jgi:hypothetical protein